MEITPKTDCMPDIDLNGTWCLQKGGTERKLPATVPGDVYADLLAAGEIPDPFSRDNELALQWIGESNWTYARTFDATSELLGKKSILLRCEGLDTFAKVTINGQVVAETDNMFRTYEWDVRELLKPGENSIRVDFTTVLPYIRRQQEKFPAWTHPGLVAAYPGWVRKEQCNFGWDWGIKAVTCGIWRDIAILACDSARLTDVDIRQEHRPGKVRLTIAGRWSRVASRGLAIRALVVPPGSKATGCRSSFPRCESADAAPDCFTAKSAVPAGKSGHVSVSLDIPDPQLWWPNGMGEQPLYEVALDLIDETGRIIDAQTKRIGLRTLELDRHEDEWGESFQFVVNGVPFFAKGANWIPVDAILARRTPDHYRRLVADATAANMNMLRGWGGGIYEDDSFYDACDELGICVWQDFMFACAAYPIFDPSFLANVEAEARDAIRRLRHHPCMALWCGNNELEMMNVGDDGWAAGQMPWSDYKKLFDELLPEQVAELSPEIAYWPSSPHTPRGDRRQHRSPLCGDAHLWIMSGREPFSCARGMEHRFASEFGFQSFPEPRTIAAFTEPEDRNLASRVMELHQRAPDGNTTIVQQLLKCFRLPSSLEDVTWVSQILQGTGVKGVCEHFRRQMPRSMGALYWQLNDCWPVASWSSIDFHGRWKALQYMAKHFFAPVLLSGVEDREKGTVDIHLTSDRPEARQAMVSWTITDVDGKALRRGSKATRTPVNGSRRIKTLRLQKLLSKHQPYNLLVWLDAEIEGEARQRNLVLFAPPKHLELVRRPGGRYRIIRNANNAIELEFTAAKVALWTWLELPGAEATLSNNFFHLRPGMSERITVSVKRPLTAAQLRQKLKIRSLVDTY